MVNHAYLTLVMLFQPDEPVSSIWDDKQAKDETSQVLSLTHTFLYLAQLIERVKGKTFIDSTMPVSTRRKRELSG